MFVDKKISILGGVCTLYVLRFKDKINDDFSLFLCTLYV